MQKMKIYHHSFTHADIKKKLNEGKTHMHHRLVSIMCEKCLKSIRICIARVIEEEKNECNRQTSI